MSQRLLHRTQQLSEIADKVLIWLEFLMLSDPFLRLVEVYMAKVTGLR